MKKSGSLVLCTIITVFSFIVCNPKEQNENNKAAIGQSGFVSADGWFVAGSEPTSYEMGIDKGAGQNGKNAATIKSIEKKINGFGTLMQECDPEKYLGKRVRMSGYMKSENIVQWAGFWFRVDQAGSTESLSFDNMQDRGVKGTTAWTKYDIVLDVPLMASNLAYGVLLSGTGQVWFDNLNFEIVDTTVQSTDSRKSGPIGDTPKEPENLDFEM